MRPEKTEEPEARTIRTALVQFDAVPEAVDRNRAEMARLTRAATDRRARWIVFHEATVTDYTPCVEELAEPVPHGPSTRLAEELARELNCWISFGLIERRDGLLHLSQVFVGQEGFVHCYRKAWLHRKRSGRLKDYRDEWRYFDPGPGPEPFMFDGVRAICFICADGGSRRCVARATAAQPQVVFFPNNRKEPVSLEEMSHYAHATGAALLVTNRVGVSWIHDCAGGCAVVTGDGRLRARANCRGREEILIYDLCLRGVENG